MEDLKHSDILLFIPAYNEEENIGEIIQRVLESNFAADLLIIDDGSEDKTAEIARSQGVGVLSHPINLGYGGALHTGYKYAVKKGYQYLIHFDADGQHDPKYIARFIEGMNKYNVDIIIGSRFLEPQGPSTTSNSRFIGIKIFAFLTSKLIKQKITDPTSGYLMLNRQAFQYLSQEIYPDDYPDADVIVMLHRTGFQIQEIPITISERCKGTSMHSGLKPVYYVFKLFLSLLVTLLRK